jgi:PleD family two-component response regulator
MNSPKKKILAVLSDLMFTVKIQDAAKRANVDVTFVTSRENALKQARLEPSVIILDLNGTSVDALELISTLKGDAETSALPLVGYVSHVQVDVKQAALDKGCDLVVARSAFSQNLPAILERYLTSANE